MKNRLTFTFLGAGSMAEAIVAGMLNSNQFEKDQIIVTNRSDTAKLQTIEQRYGVKITHDQEEALKKADVIILAMKPKDVAIALEGIKPYISETQLLLSVIAGASTRSMEGLLGLNIPIIRAMPNTSATIGRSATAISKGKYASEEHLKIAEKLFLTIGTVSIVNEEDLHTVTGLSGSGPAYFYYIIEAMEQAALELGLEKNVSKELIYQTIVGAAEMFNTSSKSPATLKKEVMSPGGTTEAGLKVLEQFQYKEAMTQCIKRAATRSKEMGAEIESNMIKKP